MSEGEVIDRISPVSGLADRGLLRTVIAAHCANLRCPATSLLATRRNVTDRVELRPVVQRSDGKNGFIGAIYAKEIRVVDDCQCQGVSISTVASGADKSAVVAQIAAEARRRAQQYSYRGYKVITTKVQAA